MSNSEGVEGVAFGRGQWAAIADGQRCQQRTAVACGHEASPDPSAKIPRERCDETSRPGAIAIRQENPQKGVAQ
jgi:hypothetical protein